MLTNLSFLIAERRGSTQDQDYAEEISQPTLPASPPAPASA